MDANKIDQGQRVKCIDDGLIYTVMYAKSCGKVAVKLKVENDHIAKFIWASRLEVVDDQRSETVKNTEDRNL